MLNRLIPLLLKLKTVSPPLYHFLVKLGKKIFKNRLGIYPRLLGKEIEAVSEVLRSSQWNMCYGKGLEHEKLEESFAKYLNVPHAIAVGSGGMALQMSIRALGMKPGNEIVHQIDTCSATAMAVMNAGVTPIFSDISTKNFMLDTGHLEKSLSSHSRAIIGTHMWGNPENMAELRLSADTAGIQLIEDACLGLGAIAQGRAAGTWGDVGVFSFGCVKPIQGGEGGMIVTSNSDLARELRAMRHWGDRTIEYGVRDAIQLSWNGRMSEIVAAVVRQQLKGYPSHLNQVRESVFNFKEFISQIPGLDLMLGTDGDISNCSFTQVVLTVNSDSLGLSKQKLWEMLHEKGIPIWHANFELINTLSLFKEGTWKDWIIRGDIERAQVNYQSTFSGAEQVYTEMGIGLGKMNFLSAGNLAHLKKTIHSILEKK